MDLNSLPLASKNRRDQISGPTCHSPNQSRNISTTTSNSQHATTPLILSSPARTSPLIRQLLSLPARARGAGRRAASAVVDPMTGSPADPPERPRPRLTVLPLVALIFYDVSGGPFGIEDLSPRGRRRVAPSPQLPRPARPLVSGRSRGGGRRRPEGAIAEGRGWPPGPEEASYMAAVCSALAALDGGGGSAHDEPVSGLMMVSSLVAASPTVVTSAGPGPPRHRAQARTAETKTAAGRTGAAAGPPSPDGPHRNVPP